MTSEPAALKIDDLSIGYKTRGTLVPAVEGVSFSIPRGGRMGLVGESGSGKTTVAMTVLRYLPRNATVTSGTIHLGETELLSLDESSLNGIRGRRVAAVYQDPGSSLNPTMPVGRQVAEVFRKHFDMNRDDAHQAAVHALGKVELPTPDRLAARYPQQLSGGQQQRVMIAMALSADPSLLILDEPTTGLDATVEVAVIELIDHLTRELDTAVLMVSHNIGLIESFCDTTAVMKDGMVVESGPARDLLAEPQHGYTRELISCIPTLDHRKFANVVGSGASAEMIATGVELDELNARLSRSDESVLEVSDLVKDYSGSEGVVHALRGVSLTMRRGEVLAVVGESGSGKSTLAKCVVGLESFSSGDLLIDGQATPQNHRKRDRSPGRSRPSLVFQNPESSLNPRRTARAVLRRALKLAGKDPADVEEVATQTRLNPDHLDRKTRRLSGGLKQRVAIARASVGNPSIVVCDEPVSALDVSVQASILNLLARRQVESGVSYLFISHDLAVVHYLADTVVVMYMGEIVERGPVEEVFDHPRHPYTVALQSSTRPVGSVEENKRIKLTGSAPSAYDHVPGCIFATRCPVVMSTGQCTDEAPPWREAGGTAFRCHRTTDDLDRRFSTQISYQEDEFVNSKGALT